MGGKMAIQKGSRTIVSVLLTFAACVFLLCPRAEAVQIKKVLSGIVNFDTTDAIMSTDIGDTVDISKSIILINNSVYTNTADQNLWFVAQFEDNRTICVQRAGATVAASVSWQVVEFTDGVKIQRGISSMQIGTLSKDITIAKIDTVKNGVPQAIPIIQYQGGDTQATRTHEYMIMPALTNNAGDATLTLTRKESTSSTRAKPVSIIWQVIEFQYDATVQTGLFQFPSLTNAETNVNYNQTITDLKNSGQNALLFFYLNPGTYYGGQDGEFYTRGTITNATTLTFQRHYGPDTNYDPNSVIDLRYYVVDFEDGTNGLGTQVKGTVSSAGEPALVGINNSTDPTSGPITITTSAVHGLSTGMYVNISGHATNTTVNGTWRVTVVDTTHFTLDGSGPTGDGAGTGGNVARTQEAALGLTNLNNSMFVMSSEGGGTTNTGIADDIGYFMGRLLNRSGNKLAVTRDGSTRAVGYDLNYIAYEFQPITLRAPNGGETLTVNNGSPSDTYHISWFTAASVTNVKIEYYDGYTWKTIVPTMAAAAGGYDWKVGYDSTDTAIMPADELNSSCLIRVSNAADASQNDISNAPFTIKSWLAITANGGNGGELWFVGDTDKNITWDCRGNCSGTAKLQYSVDAPHSVWTDISGAGTRSISDKSFNWTPLLLAYSGKTTQVKIISNTNPSGVSDTSDADFEIRGSIDVDEPNGTSIWPTGYAHSITWTLKSNSTKVDIFYSLDNGVNYTPITGAQNIDAVPSSYSWTPDISQSSNFAKIKIVDHNDPNVKGESAQFQLAGSITVTAPNGNEEWGVDSPQKIKWSIGGGAAITSVDLYYCVNFTDPPASRSYTKINVAAVAADQGIAGYDWTVPNNITLTKTAGVKVQNHDLSSVYDESDNPFKIKGWIEIIKPAASEIVSKYSDYTIQWIPHGNLHDKYGDGFNVEYSTDGGVAYGVIYSSVNGSAGSQTWLVADIPSSNLGESDSKIRVSLQGDTTIGGESGAFTVVGLKLLQPSENGADPRLIWECGTTAHITWDVQGTPAWNVNLYYTRNGLAPIELPVNGSPVPAAQRYYDWSIPIDDTVFKTGDNGENPDIKIKLVCADNAAVASISAQPVTIRSRFINFVPNGGEILIGASFNITWTTQGDVAAVNVKYSTNGGFSFDNVITSNKTNGEGWLWNPVNCPVSGTIRVRVESVEHSSIKAESAGNITAKGSITITHPTAADRGNSALIAGETYQIEWIVNGGVGSDIGLVDLYYAENGVSFGTAFAQVDTAAQNYYLWTVPSPASLPKTTPKIKIVQNTDSTVSAVSEEFDIRGKLWDGVSNHAMKTPNGGEIYYVSGADIDIKWKYKGNIGNCELYYDANSGSSYPNHIATVPHNNNEDGSNICHYSFPVPGTAKTTYRIKIYSINDQTYCYANSQGDFVVKGSVTLVSPGKTPASPELWYVDGNNQINYTIAGGISEVDIMYDKNSGKGTDNTEGTADDYAALTIANRNPSLNGANSFQWSIPGAQEATRQLVTSNKGRIRVRDSNDTSVYSDSTNDFYMKPQVYLDALQNLPWTVQDQKTITWTRTGSLSQLNLYYSSAGQSGPWGAAQITGIDASGGNVIWTIPETGVSWGNAVIKLVRVESGEEDTDVISKSGNFTVRGKINVTSPVTDQTYNVQQTGQINWNVVGAVGNVDIKYNTNSAGNYPDGDWAAFSGASGILPDYCTNAPGTPYSFTIPTNTAPNVKIRVMESSHPEVFGPPMAGSPTHSFKGSILFDKPTGSPSTKNQTIIIGQGAHTINWSLIGTFTTLRAYYKKVGESQWTQIGGDLAGTSTQTAFTAVDTDITLPDGSNKVLFRVEDALDAAAVYAETPANEGNTIKGYVELLLPVTPVELTVGNTVPVKWKKYGNIGNLKFELWNGTQWLDNGGGSNLPDSYPAGASGESGVSLVPDWTVPDKIGSGSKIRVTSINYPELTSEKTNITIKGGFSSVVTPETWYVGEDHTLNWQANGSMSSVKIELYNGTSWVTIEDSYNNGGLGLINGANSYIWPAADAKQQQRSQNCKIRITSTQNPDVYIETGNFTIKPKITVTTPAQPLVAQSTGNTIQWSAIAAPTTNVDIILEDANAGAGYPITLGSNIAKGPLQYTSAVSLPAALTVRARIRIQDTSYPAFIYGESNEFKVIGSIVMHPVDNTPNAASNWRVGSTDKYITWSHTGLLGDVNIRYKYDGGAYSAPVNASPIPAADHSFNWTPIPTVISNNVQVKIETVANPSQEFAESAAFKIRGGFVLYPAGHPAPATLNSGSSHTIYWDNLGLESQIPNAKLEFYDGTTWHNFDYKGADTGITPNSGSISWSVPTDVRSTACKFRISDPNNAEATDMTGNFEIRPVLQVTAPLSSAKWTIGTQAGNLIAWNTTGPVPTVKLEYSKDGGSTYTEVIESSITNNNTYEWNIPADKDLIPATDPVQAMVRVMDTSLASIYDESAAFTMKGSITVTGPSAASPALKVGEINNITWTTPCTGAATMGKVKIEFRKSDTEGWTLINDNVNFNASPYTTWAPPIDGITSNAKTAGIRITDIDNSEVYDDSDGFEVEGKLVLTEPIATALWPVGSTQNIGWTPAGTFSPIKIEYSKDNFVSDVHLVGSVSNSAHNTPKTAQWAGIPNDISDTVRIRISDENDPDVKAVTVNPMKIVGSFTAINAPNTAGIIWQVGETGKAVSWTSNGTITNVKIEYKTSASGGYTTIVANDPNHTDGSNSYVWADPVTLGVADENSEDCYIRISDVAHPGDVYLVSTVPFSIRPVITVSQPSLNQNTEVSSVNNVIAWNSNSNKVTKVDLYYSKTGINGTYDKLISSGVDCAKGNNSYAAWGPVDDDISSAVVVKVRDKSNDIVNNNVYGLSPVFNIVGKIVIGEPHNAENIPSGGSKTISWSKFGTIGDVKLYFYHDGAYEYIDTVDSETVTSYVWNPVPAYIENNSTVRILDASTEGTGNEIAGVSQQFNIMGHFTLNAPPATLSSAATHLIQWNNYGLEADIPNAKLEFYDGSAWHNIDYKTTDTGIVQNTGSYSWSVPTDVRSTGCKFRVSDPNNAGAADTTGTFEIRPVLALTAPTAGTKWVVGTQAGNNITWTVTGPAAFNIKLEYSKDNGNTYSYIIPLVPPVSASAGTYEWNIPTNQDIITTHVSGNEQKARIRISDAGLPALYAESALFMMKGAVTVTSPNASSPALKVGEINNIEWTTPCSGAATMGKVKIEFRKADTEAWTLINDNVDFDASPYTTWAPPIDGITNNAKTARVRITDADNTEVYDDSDGFEVEGKLVLNEPVATALWPVGSTQNISWTPAGTFSPVKIEYSKDNFAGDVHTVASVANSAHNTLKTWAWVNLPNDISDTVKIRISDENDPDVKAITANPMKIVGAFSAINAPNTAGIIWKVGETGKVISWTSVGTITNVKIEYKTSASGGYTTIAANDPGHTDGSNSYVWADPVTLGVADENSEDCYVRISDVAHPSDIYLVSAIPFSIRPVISVSQPAINQNIQVSSVNNAIAWNSNSNKVTKVDLYYSKTGVNGTYDKLINSGVDCVKGNNSYTAWGPVDDDISAAVVVKVRDKSNDIVNNNVYGLSPVFNITGKIVVGEPHSGENLKVGTSKTISWSKFGTIGDVKLYYYHDGAYAYMDTVDSETATSYIWNPVPSYVENNSTVKITDASSEGTGNEISGISAQFNIMGNFDMTNPPATLISGAPYTITWNNLGLGGEIPTARIEFYDGTAWHNYDYKTTDTGLVDNTTGSVSWSVPVDVRSTACKFRISDPNNPSAVDETTTFEIRPVLDVTAPDAGAKWTIGTAGNNIVWSTTGPVPTVKIEYSKDNGATYTYVIESSLTNNNTYPWTIPVNQDIITTHTPGSEQKARIKVSDTALAAIYDESALFMMKASITAIGSPAVNDVLKVLELKNIAWTTNCTGAANMGNVKIEFRKADTEAWTEIATVAFNASPYTTWAPPIDSITNNAKTAAIRVSDADNSEVTLTSGLFEVEGKLVINEPVESGLLWAVGSAHTIGWTPTGTFSPIKIEYSKDNFVGDVHLVGSVANSAHNTPKTWSWPSIPNDISDTMKIRVSYENDPDTRAITANPIKIVGSFTAITAPNSAGIIWKVGETGKVISWTSNGSITNVKIEYKTSATGGYTVIVGDDGGHTDGGNTFTWTDPVPDENSEDCYIRISDVAHPTDVSLVSTTPFAIRPVITVGTPALDQDIAVGTSNNTVAWNCNSSKVTKVDIYYSKNGVSGPFDKLINDGLVSVKGNNTYSSWNNVGDDISNNVVIKVRDKTNDVVNNNVYGLSESFYIVGRIISISEPHAGENLKVGNAKTISWTKAGSIGDVKLYYFHDGAYGYIDTVNSDAATSYNWASIPPTVENNSTVKIVDKDTEGTAHEVKCISSPFNILGNFAMDDASIPATLSSGSPFTIRWDNLGLGTEIPQAKLEFYDGAAWHNYDYKTADTGLVDNTAESISWSVPTDVRSIACKFRISDPNNAATTDDSKTFEIRPFLDVTAPTTAAKWVTGDPVPADNDNRIIWAAIGPVPTVKIEYSKDNGSNYTWTIETSIAGNASPYSLTVPANLDIITTHGATPQKGRIKVSDTALPAIYDESSLFMVKAKITAINSPAADEVLKVLEQKDIAWATNCSGTAAMGDVKIEFRKADTEMWTEIAVVPFDSSPYASWAPPVDAITNNSRTAAVRITDADNAEVTRTSGAFEVEGKLVLNEPIESGLLWQVGSSHTIGWTPAGTFSPIKIEYSKDNFVSDVHAVATVANSAHNTPKTWSWPSIPNDISDTMKIRVSYENDPDTKAITANPIKIVGSFTAITAPNSAGIIWKVGETGKVISWTSNGSITNVRIEYKTSATGGYTIIVGDDGGHTTGGNTYTWTGAVPDENSEDCYIRVSDVGHLSDVYKESTVPFSIRPVITVSQPAAGQNLVVGSTNNTIAWNVNSSKINKVDVYYSTNGIGGPFDRLINDGLASSIGNNTFNAWGPILDTISGDVVIRVRDKTNDAVNDNVYDLSDSFDIIGQITVTEPHAVPREKLASGSSKTISWTKQGTLGNLKIYYYHDGAYEYIAPVDSNNFNSYNWASIPNQIENNSTVKIVDEDTEGTPDEVAGVSAPFDILGHFNLTNPPATLTSGAAYSILWDNYGLQGEIPSAKLEFFDGAAWHDIDYKTNPTGHTGIVSNTGNYSWTVPVDVRSTACQFRISDPNNSTAEDSSTLFEIRPVIDVTAPVSTTKWTIGTQAGNNITWTSTGPVPAVKIEYSKDNGATYSYVIANSYDNTTGTFEWNIPVDKDIITTHVSGSEQKGRIKVSDTSLSAIFDESALFMVKGAITVTVPGAASPALKVGDPANIAWTTPCTGAADMGNVQIKFSKTGAAPWTDIASVDFSASPYTLWIPPIDAITSNAKAAKIKIEDADNSEVFDESDAFEVEGKIILDEPVGSDFIWQPGAKHTIKWTPTGTFATVKVEYSTNAFADGSQTVFVNLVANSQHNEQKVWEWTVPNDLIGDTIALRVSDNADPDVKSTSGSFKAAKIQVTYPTAGRELVCQTAEHIDYTITGTVPTVDIEYSTGYDTGTPPQRIWNTIQSNYAAGAGSHSCPWTVPTSTGTHTVVRVKDSSSLSEVAAESPEFIIRGGFSFVHPTAGERWLSSSNKLIQWTTLGQIDAVYVQYRYKNVSQQWTEWAPVNDGTAIGNTNSYLWPIPSIISTQVEIRITDTDDPAATKTSDTFVIHGSVTLTQPNGSNSKLKAGEFDEASKIKWTMSGPIPLFDLYLSTSGDVEGNYVKFAEAQASLLEYGWSVPVNVRSNNCFIKICDHDDALVVDKSDLAFWIMDNIAVTAPVSGDQWTAGANRNIAWTSEGLASAVDVKYCKEAPYETWTPIVSGRANVQGANTYAWAIPADIDLSHTYKIRISDADATYSTYSYSISPAFSIQGGITVLAPNGGTGPAYADREKWACGLTYAVRWSTLGNIAAVDILYSTDGGFSWTEIANNYPNSGAKEFPWTIPLTLNAENALIRVKDHNALFPDVKDESDHPFKILSRVAISAPGSGQVWEAGGTSSIGWVKYGPAAFNRVKIEYAINNPAFTEYAASDPRAIKVINPDKTFSGDTGTHDWAIPPEAVGYNNLRIRISKFDDAEVFVISDPFTVRANFTTIIPNGGERWLIGEKYAVSWSKIGLTYSDEARTTQAVKLTCYKRSNPNIKQVIGSVPTDANGGTYDWTIPASLHPSLVAVDPDLIMRVEDPNFQDPYNSSAYKDSANPFKILPNIVVTAPVADEQWFVDDTSRYVRWTYVDTQPTGTVGNVSMFFSKSGGAAGSWVSISGSSVPITAGEWLWPVIPDEITSQLKIKVASTDDPEVYGVTPYTLIDGKPNRASFTTAPYAKISSRFTIDPAITGRDLVVGDSYTVTWQNTGTVDTVDLEYSTDNFATVFPLKNAADADAINIANTKSFIWKVPDIYTQVADPADAHTVKIRVKSHTDAGANSVSGAFRIRGDISIVAPAASDAWNIGQSYGITWRWKGTIPAVRITYSLNGASGTFNPILENYMTPNDGIVANGAGAGGPASEFTYTWIIPDESTDQAVIRVQDARASEAAEVTGQSGVFRITGYVKVNGLKNTSTGALVDRAAVASAYNISWEWGGTMPEVKIMYSTRAYTEGSVNVANGSPDVSGTGTAWLSGVQAGDEIGFGDSDAENIQKWYTVMAVVGDGQLVLDSNYAEVSASGVDYCVRNWLPINETYGTPNDGLVAGTIITDPSGTGAGGPGSERRFTWTIPDRISPTCMLRITDPQVPSIIRATYYSPVFKIQGAFTLVAPALALNDNGTPANPADDFYECRWVTNETREVSWTTFGTIQKVDLVYSKDDFLSEIPMAGGTNVNNTGTFPWVIPNERLANPPYYVNIKVRVYDHNDHEVYVQGPASQGGVDTLKIDYYKITWDIRDLVTNQPIAGLRVNDSSGDGWSDWAASGLSSPVSHYVPAGYRTADWTHKDYGPISESYLAGWDPDAGVWRTDRTIYRTMETLVVHIWRAYSEFAYNVDADRLDITSWLERDGSLVPGAIIIDVSIYDGVNKIKRKTVLVDDDNNKLLYYDDVPNSVKLWVGDRSGEVRFMQDVIADCAPYKRSEAPIPADFSGFFQQSWSPTSYTAGGTNYAKLESGKVYAVNTYMGMATGGTFTTPVSFSVTIPATMSAVEDAVSGMVSTVNSVLDKPISVVSAELQAQLQAQTNIVESKLNEQTTLLDTKTDEMKNVIESAMTSFENNVQESLVSLKSGADKAVAAGEALEATSEKYSWNSAVSPDPALTGDTINLTCQGMAGLSPVLEIYSWDNKPIIQNVILTESPTRPGLYTYTFNADNRFAAGKAYMYMISEQTTGGFITGSGMVESMSISTVAGLASAAPEAERASKKALEAISAVTAAIGSGQNTNISLSLANLKEAVDALPGVINKEGPSTKIIIAINEVQDKLKKLAGDEGYDFSQLLEKALDESSSMKDIRGKTDEINQTVDVLDAVMEQKFGGIDSPLISVSLQPGSVKFRIVAVNPSKTKSQKFTVQNYLPVEVRPQDVLDAGGLSLEYDSAKSLYYVYAPEIELGPGETRVFDVEVEDIWQLPESGIKDVKTRVDAILERLKDSRYYESAREIADTIYPRLDEIVASQSDESVSRERHIGAYRQNVMTMDLIKEDIGRLEKILVTAGGPPSPEMLAKTRVKADEPSKTMTWIVIFSVIVFMGLLAAVFFFTWFRQSSAVKEDLEAAKKAAFPPAAGTAGVKK